MKQILCLTLLYLLFSCSEKSKKIVAEVNNESIFLADLSEATKQELFDLLNMAYEIKSKALDDLIKKKLLEKEAGDQNLTIEQYLDQYMEAKIGADKDSVMMLYGITGNRTSVVRSRLHSSSSEEMEGELASKNKLRSIIIQQLADSLYSKASIKKYIFPPKQPECVIADLCAHYRGNMKSTVSFIVASDFNCERCVAFESTLQRIYNKYKDRVKFGFVNYADAPTLPALACEAAGRQNKFWEFHDSVFKHEGIADSIYIFRLAKANNLNMEHFNRDLKSSDNYKKLDKTINELVNRGVFATPTIIINDRLIYMTNSYEELSKLLDYELKSNI